MAAPNKSTDQSQTKTRVFNPDALVTVEYTVGQTFHARNEMRTPWTTKAVILEAHRPNPDEDTHAAST